MSTRVFLGYDPENNSGTGRTGCHHLQSFADACAPQGRCGPSAARRHRGQPQAGAYGIAARPAHRSAGKPLEKATAAKKPACPPAVSSCRARSIPAWSLHRAHLHAGGAHVSERDLHAVGRRHHRRAQQQGRSPVEKAFGELRPRPQRLPLPTGSCGSRPSGRTAVPSISACRRRAAA